MWTNFYRIIDANANRVREGLRVVEEITRLLLDNSQLTGRCKKIRHRVTELIDGLPGSSDNLTEERNSNKDVGKGLYPEEESERKDYQHILRVNARRAEEGMRVLEEFAKLLDTRIAAEFKNLRFELYSAEKEVSSLLRALKTSRRF